MYNILEVCIEYKAGKLNRVTVLVKISEGDVRAIFSTPDMPAAYDSISPDEPVTDNLLQRVAGYGRQTVDIDIIFRGWRKKYFPSTKRL